MNEKLDNIMFAHMPDQIKVAVATYQTHKLVEGTTGLDDITFAKVAAHLSQMVAERQARWQSIGDGLLALDALQKSAAMGGVSSGGVPGVSSTKGAVAGTPMLGAGKAKNIATNAPSAPNLMKGVM